QFKPSLQINNGNLQKRDENKIKTCKKELFNGVYWEDTNNGNIARAPCPNGLSGQMKRHCNLNGFWLFPNSLNCSSIQFSNNIAKPNMSKNSTILYVNNILANRNLLSGEIIQIINYLNIVHLSLGTYEILSHIFHSSNRDEWKTIFIVHK
ncbi:hypothetical protein MXB_732, partial [Myxobolus squamalis]